MARSRRSGISTFFPNIFSNRDESLAGEDRWRPSEWKRAAIGIIVLAVGIAIVEGIFHLTHFQSFHTVVILVSLILTAGFPQMACDSIAPFLRPRISFVDGHVVIRGERLTSIGRLASYALFLAFAVFFIISGFIAHELVRTLHFALIPACFAYFLYSMNPLRGIKTTLSDTSTTTSTLEGISFHFPELLSVEEDPNDRDVTILWTDNVTIDDIIHPTIFLHADPDIYDGPWGISSERIGIPFTGLDALMRHFNEHPEDRPLLATPQGVDLVNDIVAEARAALTTPQRRRP